jgi:PAT family beta-lactamase induction signal transducer AmpG
VPSLYIAMSLPYNIALFVSQQYFKSREIEIPVITFWVSLIGLTWSFKPLWSPLCEMAREKKRIVIWAQVGLAILFCALALVVPLTVWFSASIALLWLFAFFSATQDIAADGVYVTTLDRKTMTLFSGIQSAAWMGGKVLAMGGLVYLAGRLERSLGVSGAWASVFVLMAAVMLAAALYHGRVLPKGSPRVVQVHSLPEAASVFVGIIEDFLKKPRIGWMIAFIVLYRVSESQVSSIAQLFLRDARENGGAGLSTEQVGICYGTVATLGLVAGSLVGGKLVARYTLERSLRFLILVFNLPIALFAYLAWSGTANLWTIGVCTTLEQFCVGMGMIACINYIMQQLAPGRFAMAHYGLGTALMNLGVSVPAMASGKVAVTLGYPMFFVYALIVAVPSILVSFLVPFPGNPDGTGPSDQAEP